MLFNHFMSELVDTPSASFPGARRVNKAAVELARVTDRRHSLFPSGVPLSSGVRAHPVPSHPIPLTALFTQLCSAGSVLLFLPSFPSIKSINPSESHSQPYSNSNSLPISSCRLSIFLMKIESILSSSLFPWILFRFGRRRQAARGAGPGRTVGRLVKASILGRFFPLDLSVCARVRLLSQFIIACII